MDNIPSNFVVETVVGCNLKCPECAWGGGLIRREHKCMAFEDFRIIADKIAPYAKYMYLHDYGEPLINPDIFRIIEYASKICDTNISTNGMIVDEDNARKLIQSGVKDVIVSIDGVSQKVYEKYRKGGNVQKALSALQYLVQINEDKGNKVNIIPQFIVFEHNMSEMDDFRRYCKRIGIRPFFKEPYVREDSIFKNSPFKEYTRLSFENDEKYEDRLLECRAFEEVLTIDVNGNVIPCCYDFNSEVVLGNLFDESVEDVLNGEKYISFIRNFEYRNLPDLCRRNCLMYRRDQIQIALWGGGKYGKAAYDGISSDSSYEIVSVCDMDETKVGTEFHKYVIVHPLHLKIQDYDMLLLCSSKWEDMYLYARTEMMVPNEKIFLWDGSKIIKWEDAYPIPIHSQDGEELFLIERFIYEKKKNVGFFVDVGAYHPIRFSNTLWAYKEGWKGINIEPNYESYKLFEQMRSNDININVGISDKESELDYYQFYEGGINTFDKERAEYLIRLGYEIKGINRVPVVTLQSILDKYDVTHIDFLDIDVEGHEKEVINGIDFNKVDIDYILVEQLQMDLEAVVSSEIAQILREHGYCATCKFDRSVIYEKRNQ